MFKKIDSLRFWCNKILPLVYDDSLSYYETLCKIAEKLNIELKPARIHSSDVFYYEGDLEQPEKMVEEQDALCVEMESFALFHNAKVLNKKAACLLTVSDSLCTNEHLSTEERQTSFNEMITLALESAIRL